MKQPVIGRHDFCLASRLRSLTAVRIEGRVLITRSPIWVFVPHVPTGIIGLADATNEMSVRSTYVTPFCGLRSLMRGGLRAGDEYCGKSKNN
jgi:hypothetical protein